MTRPMGAPYRGPRTLGGLAVYLLAIPAFLAVLIAPGLVLAALLGAATATMALRAADRDRTTDSTGRSATRRPR